jgi:tetratricopeptide (TPR) repeat protein
MKALEKDRNRRYETANAFAADVQRYLADEPVQACPPSAWYRVRKFTRRNKAGLATGTVVALAVLLSVGTLGWMARDHLARQRETDRGVTAALAQVETLLAEGDELIDNPVRWQATARLALAAAEKADELLATGAGTDDIAGRVRQARAAVEETLTDSRLLVELDRIRLDQAVVKGDGFDNSRAAPRYAELLGSYGLNLSVPETAAARVRGSRLRNALLAALGDWSRVSQDEDERHRVEAVWQLANPPDAFRARWGAAVNRRDNAELVKLANDPAAQSVPPATLVNMARNLTSAKELAAGERLLRGGQERNPGDFWLNHELGMVLVNQGRARADEAVGYLRAALALRSDSPGVYLNLGLALETKGDTDDAIRCYRTALQIDPNYAAAHNNLGNALRAKKDLDGAIQEYRAAIHINPNYYGAHNNLGSARGQKGDWEGAIREHQAALQINPNDACARNNIGVIRGDRGDLEGAIREYRAAIQIDPKFALAHENLGGSLRAKGELDGAIKEFQAAISIDPNGVSALMERQCKDLDRDNNVEATIRVSRAFVQIDPKSALAHNTLGVALSRRGYRTGKLEEAIRELQASIRIDPNFPLAHHYLGNAFRIKGDLDEAIREYRAAIQIDHKSAIDHTFLGNVLERKGDLDGAIREYAACVQLQPKNARAHCQLGIALLRKGDLNAAMRENREAIGLQKDYPEAHCNLGHVLAQEFRIGHELGSRNPQTWKYPSAQWLRDAERMAGLDVRLPKIVKGADRPGDAGERVALAQLCQHPYRQLNSAAARFYAEAFAVDPKLAEDLRVSHRYNAACVAALAGCGKGKDAGELDAKERKRLRRQAVAWLRADLAAWKQPAKNSDKTRPMVQQTMQHWQQDEDFAGVRGDALAKLPETERQEWQKLWQEVDELGKRVAEVKAP